MPFIPAIASGFDPLAQQGEYYAGLNADIQRQNINAVQQANQERNAYMFNAAQLQQRAAERDEAIRQNAIANAMSSYQFNRQMALAQQKADQTAALKQEQLDLGAKADTQAQTARKTEMTDAENLQAASDLATKGKFASMQDLQAAIPNATADQIKELWDTNSTVRNATDRETSFAGALATQLNARASLSPQLKIGPPSTVGARPALPWWHDPVTAGATLRNPYPINTSWFDALKGHAAALDQQLAKAGLAFNDQTGAVMTPPKTSLSDFGIVLNPKTGKYETVSPDAAAPTAPAWVGAARAGAPASAASGPPVAAISYLKQHPEMAAQFDEKYGAGSSDAVLNQ